MKQRIYDRVQLYKEVWEEPMTSLAKRYGVSDVALRKQCIKMDIPLPKAGHWTKVRFGYKAKRPPLPKRDMPDKVVVKVRSEDSSSREIEDALLFLSKNERERVIEYCLSLIIPDKLEKPHELIIDTKQYHRLKKESKRPLTNRVINLKVSDGQMTRAYKFYNTLFKALEHFGYILEIRESNFRQYRNRHELYVCLKEDCIPIFLREKQKKVKRDSNNEKTLGGYDYGPSYDYIMTGKLHFEIDSYHAKRKNWNDTKTKKIENQIGEIIIWIMEAIQVEKSMRVKREAEKARLLEEQRINQEIAERREKELKQIQLLSQYAIDWEKAERIRKFADKVEIKLSNIEKEEEKEKLTNWLIWTREKADFIDPLVEKNDEILDESFTVLNQIFKEKNSVWDE